MCRWSASPTRSTPGQSHQGNAGRAGDVGVGRQRAARGAAHAPLGVMEPPSGKRSVPERVEDVLAGEQERHEGRIRKARLLAKPGLPGGIHQKRQRRRLKARERAVARGRDNRDVPARVGWRSRLRRRKSASPVLGIQPPMRIRGWWGTSNGVFVSALHLGGRRGLMSGPLEARRLRDAAPRMATCPESDRA